MPEHRTRTRTKKQHLNRRHFKSSGTRPSTCSRSTRPCASRCSSGCLRRGASTQSRRRFPLLLSPVVVSLLLLLAPDHPSACVAFLPPVYQAVGTRVREVFGSFVLSSFSLVRRCERMFVFFFGSFSFGSRARAVRRRARSPRRQGDAAPPNPDRCFVTHIGFP
jgi:hypothetical protein